MAFFERERELCELFIKNMKRQEIKFTYDINTSAVSIYVCYKSSCDWNDSDGRKYLNKLWKNFNLAFIGYRHRCIVLKHNRKNFRDCLTEYLFPMIHFNIDNFYSPDF